jgi:hypothetical protein
MPLHLRIFDEGAENKTARNPIGLGQPTRDCERQPTRVGEPVGKGDISKFK